jgi:hypothetical protein
MPLESNIGMDKQALITAAYRNFNMRHIDAVLALMHPAVLWPNGWEGGYVKGHSAVRDYWTRQWNEINPTVQPISFTETAGGGVEVTVHQTVKNLNGDLLFDGTILHIYSFDDGLITAMEIKTTA